MGGVAIVVSGAAPGRCPPPGQRGGMGERCKLPHGPQKLYIFSVSA